MEKHTRVELTEERVREIVREIVREELAKAVMDIVSRSLEANIKALTTIWSRVSSGAHGSARPPTSGYGWSTWGYRNSLGYAPSCPTWTP